MIPIFLRELRAWLTSSMGYVLLSGFVIAISLLGLYVMPRSLGLGPDWFVARELSMTSFFAAFPWVAVVILPALSMRAWAEEAHKGTAQTLLTLPVPMWKMVAGKYLAGLAMLALMLLATAVYPVMVMSAGGTEVGAMLLGYIGCFFLGAAFLGVGTFISTLTKNQMSAFIAGFLACAAMIGWGFVAEQVTGSDSGTPALIGQYIAVDWHFRSISAGLLRFDSLIFFISLSIFFLVLSTFVLERRRFA